MRPCHNLVVTRSPDRATLATEGLPCPNGGGGDLRSKSWHGQETASQPLTVPQPFVTTRLLHNTLQRKHLHPHYATIILFLAVRLSGTAPF